MSKTSLGLFRNTTVTVRVTVTPTVRIRKEGSIFKWLIMFSSLRSRFKVMNRAGRFRMGFKNFI